MPADELDIADFAALRAEIARVSAAAENPWWSPAWVVDHLATFSAHPEKLKTGDVQLAEMIEHWICLTISEYLSIAPMRSHAADVHGFHLSEYLELDAAGEDLDEGRTRAAMVRDFFAFLNKGA